MFDNVEAFYRPGDVREALRLLESGKGRARILAGGTDVVVEPDRSIRILIDITKAGLSYIRRKEGVCTIGATTTMAELEASPVIRGLANGILAEAAAACGSVQNRNLATIGGNLSNGSPAADTAVPLLALDAEVVIAHAKGRRKLALPDFYEQIGNGLLEHAMVVEIAIPVPPRAGRWSFLKLGRTQVDIALVSVAAGLQLDSRDRVKWMRISLGGVAPTPKRATAAEELAAGRPFGDALQKEIADAVASEVRPISDVRASAEYRLEMSRVLTRRGLENCVRTTGCSL